MEQTPKNDMEKLKIILDFPIQGLFRVKIN